MKKLLRPAVVATLLLVSSAVTAASYCEQKLDLKTCEQIGQMLVVGFGGLKQDQQGKTVWSDPHHLDFHEESFLARDIREQHVGGVILYSHDMLDDKTKAILRERNVRNPEQVAKLNQDLITYSAKVRKQQGLKDLPLFITIDQEGGMNDRLPAVKGFSQVTVTPQSLGYNQEIAGRNSEQVQRAKNQSKAYIDELANQLRQLQFNVDFAPLVDVNVNAMNPVIGGMSRSFSANPKVVADQAKIFVDALHRHNIKACLKHFPGHGSSSSDSHLGIVDVSNTYDMKRELYPYITLINSGYKDFIMTSHVINGNIDKTQCMPGAMNDPATWCPMTLSEQALTNLLREQLQFEGVIISDDMTMGAIANYYPLPVSLEKGINAGVDMFIFANHSADQTEEAVNIITDLIVSGKISKERIQQSYDRIVTLKTGS